MRQLAAGGLVFLLLVAGVTPCRAQTLGTIAGAVKDATGAVLPGVTVEVASPALIEKTRAAVTDGAGQYTIVNLPVGTYSVTFSLTGFNSSRREGIDVAANFTANVNAEMKVGAIAETVTVTGDAPVVDVQSATTVRAITPLVIRAVPSGGTMYLYAAMNPGVTLSGGASVVDVGGMSGSNVAAQLSAHGGAPGDELQMLDGIKVGNMQSNAGRTGYTYSPLLFAQVDVLVSGQTGDSPTLGVQTNAIPRSGSNLFSGTVFANGSKPSLQSNNLTSRLQATSPDLSQIAPWGLTSTSSMKALGMAAGSFGGPIVKDRIWFYAAGMGNTNQSYVAGLYYPVDPAARVRVSDVNDPAYDDQYVWDTTQRFTISLSPKLQVTEFNEWQHKWYNHYTISAAISPEATPKVFWPRHFHQGTITYTASNRLLFEAGANYQEANDEILPRPGEPDSIQITETGGTFNGAVVPPITYGGFAGITYEPDQQIEAGKASMSYVTGTHNFKLGTDLQHGHRGRINPNFSNDLAYRTTDYILNQVTVFAPAGSYRSNLDYNYGFYAQDRWTMSRLTLSGALRLDVQKESYDAYTTPGPSPYLPNRVPQSFPAANVTAWRDLEPRFGFAYDLFGNGKTAIKASAARGVVQEGLNTAELLNPAVAISTSVARTVTDRNLNGSPDCDLTNPLANGECGPWLTTGFGSQLPSTRQDPATLSGWNVRPWNWEFTGSIQHELMPRVSVGLTYFRRINGGFLTTINTADVAADFTRLPVVVPGDGRLPVSGQTLTVYDINPVLKSGLPFNTTANEITFASNYGAMFQHWNGFDLTTQARLKGNATLQGGVTLGKTMNDDCSLIAAQPQLVGSTPVEYCHNETGWQPQVKLLANYELPWYGLRVSGNFQSLPGPAIQAGVIYTGAQLAPALGRTFSGGTNGQKTVNVFDPNTAFGDRLNQLDIRFARIFKIGRSTLDADFDLYNAFNSDASLALTSSYGGTNGGAWLKPTAIIQGRIFKAGIRWDF
jgi:Carboxypeptidase regulatory-like domain